VAALDDLADRLDAAAEALLELGPGLAAGEPWPLADVYGPGPESSWGPREVLAHVAEMLPYWMGEIELILDGGVSAGSGGAAEAPEFGRTEEDDLRVGIIGRDRGFPARELLGRVEVESKRLSRRFRALNDEDAATIGRHRTRGELSVRDVAERLIVSHVEGHVTQLREAVAGERPAD
jgi:DinB family protein